MPLEELRKNCDHVFERIVFTEIPNYGAITASDSPSLRVPVCMCCSRCGKTIEMQELDRAKKIILDLKKGLDEILRMG